MQEASSRSSSTIVHVVGTGTIGEPLIGMSADHREVFGIDEVTFHKRTPLVSERAKVNDLTRQGAVLCVDRDRRSIFEDLGHVPKYETREGIERASVVVDCTPAGNGNKEQFYESAQKVRGFLAQGSEFGFGKMYARGINDAALVPGDDQFLQVVSCNTHNIAVLIRTLAIDLDEESQLANGSASTARSVTSPEVTLPRFEDLRRKIEWGAICLTSVGEQPQGLVRPEIEQQSSSYRTTTSFNAGVSSQAPASRLFSRCSVFSTAARSTAATSALGASPIVPVATTRGRYRSLPSGRSTEANRKPVLDQGQACGDESGMGRRTMAAARQVILEGLR